MGADDLTTQLTNIKTRWTLLFQAHRRSEDAAETAARQQLLLRYYGAVYRYLLGTVRDVAAAEELSQEFAVRFLRGDFHRANPDKGRFRDFVKTSLRRLALDYWKKQANRRAVPLDPSEELAGPVEDASATDQPFLDEWRDELLARVWEALEEVQQRTGQPYCTLLRWKTERPQGRSVEFAARLGDLLGKSYTETAVRKLLQRAREDFGDLLLEEVSRSLETTEPDRIEQELIELQLLDYCRPALDRRERKAQE